MKELKHEIPADYMQRLQRRIRVNDVSRLLYEWVFQNFGIWVIGGIVVWKVAKSAVSGDTGSAIWACDWCDCLLDW